MSNGLYLVELTQPNKALISNIRDEYRDNACVVDDRLVFIYQAQISTCTQMRDRLGISTDGPGGIVVEMSSNKYSGVLRADVVDWLAKVENERK